VLCHLNDKQPHARVGTVLYNPLPWLKIGIPEQTPRGRGIDPRHGRILDWNVAGYTGEFGSFGHKMRLPGSGTFRDVNMIAGTELSHSFSSSHRRQIGQTPVVPENHPEVGRIDRRSAHGHKHFVGAECGERAFSKGKHLARRPEGGMSDCVGDVHNG